jgi:hypothetical protein
MVELEQQLKFGVENSKGRDNLGETDLDGRIVIS